MYKFIELTRDETTKTMINLCQVVSITKRMAWNKACTAFVEQGSVILYSGDNNYYEHVKESYEEIIAMLSAQEKR